MSILLIFLLAPASHAQSVQIIFRPNNPYFFSVDEVWNYSIMNNGIGTVNATVEITLYKGGSFLIYHAATSPVYLTPGENMAQVFSAKTIGTTYASDETGLFLKNTGVLPAGNYSLCVWIKSLQNAVLNQSCREININAITPPILTYPYNQEILNTGLPLLQWIPVMPGRIPQLQYILEIWETNSNHRQFLAKSGITSLKTSENSFQYNAQFRTLTEGKTYQWQVTAYSGSWYLGKSQTWEFSIESNTSANRGSADDDSSYETSSTDTDSYRVIGDETAGADYVARGYLKITFNNVANDTILPYKISLMDKQDVFFNTLPVQAMGRGLNRMSINLSSTGLFSNDEDYTMEIDDSNGRTYFLNFRYLTP